ncbi:DUF4124 domain-containing protein [Burkholderiaceae bacterium DAT-1]|nr:DUF4124 domain-containing protein [Burkholderiaceae bacterium DAT-1]
MRFMLAALLSAAVFAGSGGHYFRWTDEHGRTQLSDAPPSAMPKGGYVELNAGGLVIKRFTPEPSQEQKQALEKEKQDLAERQESDRRDKILLATFSRTSEIDAIRDQETDLRKARIQADQMRIEAAQKKLAQLQKRADAASKNKQPVNAELQKQIDEKQQDLAALDQNIKRSKQEIIDIAAKAETNKKRLVQLVGPSAIK